VVKVKQDGRIANRSIYLAVGVNQQGRKEVLGFWAAENVGTSWVIDLFRFVNFSSPTTTSVQFV
jgi:transposase-like protein